MMQNIPANPLRSRPEKGPGRFSPPGPPAPTEDKGFVKAFWSHLTDSRLEPTERLLLLILERWDWVDPEGVGKAKRYHPCNEAIAAALGVKKRQAQRWLKSLEAKGFLEIRPTDSNPTRRVLVRKAPERPVIPIQAAATTAPRAPKSGPKKAAERAPELPPGGDIPDTPGVSSTSPWGRPIRHAGGVTNDTHLRSYRKERTSERSVRRPDGGKGTLRLDDNDGGSVPSGAARSAAGLASKGGEGGGAPASEAPAGVVLEDATVDRLTRIARLEAELKAAAAEVRAKRERAGRRIDAHLHFEGFTAHQLEFLGERLTEGQFAAFLRFSPEKQLFDLAPFAESLDGIMYRHLVKALDCSSEPVEREKPADAAEFLRALPSAPMSWTHEAAELLAQSFGTPKDRQLWGEFNKVTFAVHVGGFEADKLVDAFTQAMSPKAKNRGAVFNHALKRHGWNPARVAAFAL